MTQVAENKVVLIHYTLTVDGQVVDSSDGGDPLPYLHGHDNIVPGLENALSGTETGKKVQVSVDPSEGYGQPSGTAPQGVPRDAFPEDAPVQPGMQFFVQDQGGNPAPIWIAKVEGETVFITQDHPLAGKTLEFDVEVVSIREATSEELQHGHPHGPDGTHSH